MGERIMTDEQLLELHDDIRDGFSMIVAVDHYNKLEAERDEYHDQYHLAEAKLLSHRSLIRQGQVAYEKLKKENSKLKNLGRKVVLCFPDEIPEDEAKFDIPAYIIEELKQALKGE